MNQPPKPETFEDALDNTLRGKFPRGVNGLTLTDQMNADSFAKGARWGRSWGKRETLACAEKMYAVLVRIPGTCGINDGGANVGGLVELANDAIREFEKLSGGGHG